MPALFFPPSLLPSRPSLSPPPPSARPKTNRSSQRQRHSLPSFLPPSLPYLDPSSTFSRTTKNKSLFPKANAWACRKATTLRKCAFTPVSSFTWVRGGGREEGRRERRRDEKHNFLGTRARRKGRREGGRGRSKGVVFFLPRVRRPCQCLPPRPATPWASRERGREGGREEMV